MNDSLKKELSDIRAKQKVLFESLMALDENLRKLTDTLNSQEETTGPIPTGVSPPAPAFATAFASTGLSSPGPVLPPPLPSVPNAGSSFNKEKKEVPVTAWEETKHVEAVSPAFTPESPAPVKEGDSFEFRLGQVWLIRLGVLLFLTGMVFLGNMAYHSFITKLPPVAKAIGLYVISGGLVGLGLFLERWRESLKNYGQVLLGGGLAAVYYTTYASHFVPQLKWIESLGLAALLLFGCASVITWMADWKKSQTLGTMGLLLAYYSCVINPVSWFTLLSNLLLGAAALALLIRNRWSICSWLALPATYGAYAYWQFIRGGMEEGVGGFWISAAFLSSYWLLFTVGIFLCRSGQCSDEGKASFISLNNILVYALMFFSMPKVLHEPFLWAGTLGYGVLLVGLGALAGVKAKEGPALCHAYVVKGLLFLTAGFFLKFSGYQLSMVLVMQSAVLLLAARDPFRLLFRIGAGVTAFVALAAGIDVFMIKANAPLFAGLFVSLIFLFQAWWEGFRHTGEGQSRERIQAFSMYYVVLAMIASLIVGVVHLPLLWKAPVLALLALGLTWMGPRLRLPELSVGAQGFLWTALGVWFWQRVEAVPPWWNMLVVLGSVLMLSAWWQRQGRICMEQALVQLGVFFAALAVVVMLYLRLEPAWDAYQWIIYGGILAFASLLYALVFRNWAIALFSQVFLILAVFHFLEKTTGRDLEALPALVPMAAVLAMGLALKGLQERKPDESSGGWSTVVLSPAALIYRLLAMFMSLFWIHAYVSDVYLPGFLGIAGMVCVLGSLRSTDWLRYGFGAFLIMGGLLIFWFDPVRGQVTRWADLAVILAPALIQQVNKHWLPLKGKERWQEILEILLSVVSLWIFSGNVIKGFASGFYLSAGWSVYALMIFGFGFLLKERTYRLAGLFILACTVGRIVFVDLWQINALTRILSLMVCGVVLGFLGFIYNRYAETIKKYL